VVHEQLGELGAVARVLVDAELDVLGELLVKLLEVLGVLLDLAEELDRLLDDVLLDDLRGEGGEASVRERGRARLGGAWGAAP
jgi:hypothetical protein